MKNQKEEEDQILDDVGESRRLKGEEQTGSPLAENKPEVKDMSEQEITAIEQAKEQIGQTATVGDQEQIIRQPSKEAQLPPIPPAGTEEIPLPEAEIARSDERLLPVTPIGEFAETVKTLEKEEAFPKEEEAVDRAREIEQGKELEEVIGQKNEENK